MSLFLRRALIRGQPRATHGSIIPVVFKSRSYASKHKGKGKQPSEEPRTGQKGSHANATSNLVPASQRAFLDEGVQAEYDKTSSKMSSSIDWLRKEVAGITARGIGHVTPALLDPVRVVVADGPKELRLEEVATVGIREGTNFIITLFEDENMKYVEKAIYAAKLPNIVPQKVDGRTIKIMVPRPTMEARSALLNTASKIAEDTRVQIRKTRDVVARKNSWKPRTHSEEIDRFQKLCDNRIKEVDQILNKAKQELGK
ncbi:ribosome recycling factor [Hysterangium stoloniferum]|nr:ribosome recycling factor [Hysterangium stoloniferum]